MTVTIKFYTPEGEDTPKPFNAGNTPYTPIPRNSEYIYVYDKNWVVVEVTYNYDIDDATVIVKLLKQK